MRSICEQTPSPHNNRSPCTVVFFFSWFIIAILVKMKSDSMYSPLSCFRRMDFFWEIHAWMSDDIIGIVNSVLCCIITLFCVLGELIHPRFCKMHNAYINKWPIQLLLVVFVSQLFLSFLFSSIESIGTLKGLVVKVEWIAFWCCFNWK